MLFTLTASNRRAAHRGRKEMVDRIGRGGVAACCVVTVMPPPGAKQGNRKTGQNSKANRPPDRIFTEGELLKTSRRRTPKPGSRVEISLAPLPRGPQQHNIGGAPVGKGESRDPIPRQPNSAKGASLRNCSGLRRATGVIVVRSRAATNASICLRSFTSTLKLR